MANARTNDSEKKSGHEAKKNAEFTIDEKRQIEETKKNRNMTSQQREKKKNELVKSLYCAGTETTST